MARANTTPQQGRHFGIAGTIVFHALLLLILVLCGLHTPLPLPAEQGIEVAMGSDLQGMGIAMPQTSAQAAPQKQTTKAETEEIITQNTEETPAIAKKKKTEIKKTEKEDTKKEVSPKPVLNNNALYKGRISGTGKDQSQGNGKQAGYQGTPDGSSTSTANGTGGNGISYDLSGRNAQSLPKPAYNSPEQGRVVVSIWVNREGRVTRVVSGTKGTTVTDPALIRQAESAARQARFSTNPNGPEEQVGKITYMFIKVN